MFNKNSNFISEFCKSSYKNKNKIAIKSRYITDSKNLTKDIDRAAKFGITILDDFDNFNDILREINIKEFSIDKNVNTQNICLILKTIHEIHNTSINSVDCIILKYDVYPIICLINKSKINSINCISKLNDYSIELDLNSTSNLNENSNISNIIKNIPKIVEGVVIISLLSLLFKL